MDMAKGMTVENAVWRWKGKRIPLISGEFHYWRVLRENWPPIIARIKEMGLSVVATYIPWNYHELAPGQYDFTGRTSPQRDLTGFLDLLKRERLHVIIRPGPYIYAEWPHGGPPERATKHDRMSPEFLAMARDYLRAVCRVLAPRQITRGGNIILCQADNEPYPPIESFGNRIGCFKDKGLFKDWLRRKHNGDLDLLNRRWRTAFSSFDDACFYFHEECVNVEQPLAQRLLPDREYHLRYADCFEFIGWYAARIVETIGGYLREGGIEVPIFANSWSPLYADFSQFCAVAALAGMDIYPSAFMEGSAMLKDNWRYNMNIVKMAEADVTNGNVWSAEFQSGIYPIQDVGYLPPQHFFFISMTSVAHGLKGWNWYMLVNRDNWYHCPINEWGRTNEYFPVQQKIVAAVKAIEPWQRQALYDAAVFVWKPHRVIAPGNSEEVLRALEQAGLNYCYYNPDAGNPPGAKVMVYAGPDWVAGEAAVKLECFVRAGGILIAFSRYPARDEFDRELTGLGFQTPEGARPTNLPVTIAYRGGTVAVTSGGHLGSKVNFVYFRAVTGTPVRATLSTRAREVLVDIGATNETAFLIGYARPLGKGKIIYIGSNPSPEILRLVLEQEGVAGHVFSDASDVSTTVHRHRNGNLAVFVINRGGHARTVPVALNTKRLGLKPSAAYTIRNIIIGDVRTVKGEALSQLMAPLAAHDVLVWDIAPAHRNNILRTL